MRGYLCFIFIFYFSAARADVFQNDKDGQVTSGSGHFKYPDQNVPPHPASRFNFKDNLFNQIQTPFFTPAETRTLMRGVTRSPLMLFQYSSPAGADLFKHYQIAGHLKLDMFYRQLEDIQDRAGGDLGALLDQARMECLKKIKFDGRGKPDLVKTMLACSEHKTAFADLRLNGSRASGRVLERVFNILRLNAQQKDGILAIVPRWELTPGGYKMDGPSKRIGRVFGENRDAFLEKLRGLIEQYRARKSVGPDDLREISYPGIPLTEQSLRDWLALKPNEGGLVLDKFAAQLAYVKTVGQYDRAAEVLNRVLMYPAIGEGYKMAARQALGFVTREKGSLMSYRGDMGRYAVVLGSASDASEQRRLEILRDMEDHDGH